MTIRTLSVRYGMAAVTLILVAALGGSVMAEVGRSLSPPAGALVAPGEPPNLIMLYTGDVIGYVDPCG